MMLAMKNITKSFPGVKALENVDFNVESGEVHALIGANGAGKSTLMKILAGTYEDYGGEILINNNKVEIKNPIDAKRNGIVIVYQEVDTALIPHLTVAENIMMDYIIEGKNGVLINWNDIKKRAKRVISELGLDINVNQKINELSLSEKQMVLIARAIFHEARYLILDEPTAPLSVEETNKLFDILRKLKNDGMSVIFISHRLNEVFQMAEKITVLRDGKIVGTFDIDDMTIDKAVEKMLGKKLENNYPKTETKIGDTLLEVKNLSGTGGINNVSLTVREGEIIGLAGLVGAGKTELCKLIFGEGKIKEGEIRLKGKRINPKAPAEAVREGLVLVPEERRKEGVLVYESIETNITLPTLEKYCRGIFMQKNKIKQVSREIIKQVGIKTPSEKQLVANLSGGNQQKVATGKWFLSDAEVFIFDELTKGVDVGSKVEIYELIGDLVQDGKGVIYASCEFGEILGLTDRIYVMYNGTVVKELVTKDTTEEELLYYAAGGGLDE
ncbi:ABC transporter [Petrotoga halophila DSM 16923]|jgi:simple sugar transport system ATP-binding protein|uniref:ABC transporter n=2 Tax=Petrotoga TaxID=28236 RepID=A0A2S5EIL2_9BACT|nr:MULTISPECIES: sugar ABC transporter ATP-binding protein [Petrotoga]POZ92981.1 ABC transporter [Petrotoga halophila DSM 16923]